MLTVVILGFSFVTGGSAAQARPVGQTSIEELVRMYRSGRHEEAVSPATRWSAERITLEIGRLLAEDARPDNAEEREVTRLAAVAILTESAMIHVRKGDPGLVAPGLWTAGRILEAEPLVGRGRSFARRFYLLAGLVLHWHVEIAVGHQLLLTALQSFPDDPELLTEAGSIIETVAALREYELPGGPDATARSLGGYRSEGEGHGGSLPGASLVQAEARYERALALDPGLDEARLRLAHVRLLQGRADDALGDLERVATEARQPRQRYLARLFEGRAREKRGDLTGAAAAFRACAVHVPRAQTALLALGRSLDGLGDELGAQAAFASASAVGAPFDPWWSYRAGQPERFDDLVAELRGLVE
jgi:tetratricopeptide (TPR) repeat protein